MRRAAVPPRARSLLRRLCLNVGASHLCRHLPPPTYAECGGPRVATAGLPPHLEVAKLLLEPFAEQRELAFLGRQGGSGGACGA